MSNPESFVDEVTEDLRRDRLFALFRRYGWIALLGVALLVGGAAYKEWSAAQARSAAEAKGDQLLTALEQAGPEAQVELLAASDGVLARLLEAGIQAQAENVDAARALYDGVAQDATLEPIYRDLAALKSAMLPGDADARRATLTGLAQPGAPLRLLAMEQHAYLDLESGDRDAALSQLRAVYEDAGRSADMATRVASVMMALGVDPTAENEE